MADQKITDDSALAGASVDVDNDVLPIVDVSEAVAANRNKKITPANLKIALAVNLDDVLSENNDGGANQIKNIANPTDAQDAATKAYADNLVIGLWDDRGNFDASVNAYPSSGGSGAAGAILKGDSWTISVAGTLPTDQVVEVGDVVRALVDTPGNTQANWGILQNNTGNASETAKGVVEEATDAETAAGTASGATGAKLFVTPAKLITWWTAIKAMAQTITAKWTFNDVALTNQIEATKKVGVYIDTDGTLKKVAEAVYDSTLKKWVFTGSDTSGSTSSVRWQNSALESILELFNDKVAVFGGDSAILEVNQGTQSGNAMIRCLVYTTGAGIGYRFQDEDLNDYIILRSLETDRAVIIRQKVEENFGQGEVVITNQYSLTLPNTTASANHVIFEFELADGEHYDIKVLHAEANALDTDGSKSISSMGHDSADVRKITSVNIEGTTHRSEQNRNPDTVLSGEFNWVKDTSTQKIQYCFRNGASPDNETYLIFVHMRYVKRLTPIDE